MADANIIVRLIDQTGPGLNRVQGNLDKIEKGTSRVSRGFKAMAGAAAGFVASLGVASVVRYVDQIQTLDNRLRLVTENQGQLNQRFSQLIDISNRTRSPLSETVTLFSRIALNAESIGINTAEALQVTENFSKALAISGATTAEAQSAMLQFSQALAGGTLRGEEFNAINEAAPRVMQVLADTLGITKGQLREYASDGLLNAELVSRALISATQELDDQFAQTSVTVGQALTILSNNFTTLSRDFLNSTGAGSILADVILAVAESLDILVPIVAVGAVGAFGALLVAISPIAAVIAGVTVALGAIAVASRTAINAFGGWEGILNAAKRAFLSFKIGALQVIEDFVNSSIGALANFKGNIIATFSGIGAAILDPLNAFDAFNTAFSDSITENLQEGSAGFVDFSDSIDAAQSELARLESQVVDNGDAQSDLNRDLEDSADATDDTADATGDYTDKVDDNSGALVDNGRNTSRLEALLGDLNGQVTSTTNAYQTFTAELERSAELARLDSEERRIQETLYRALEARAKDLDVAVGDLSDEERRQTEERVRQLLELEQENRTYQENVEDFTRQTNELIENNYRNTASAIQQIEDEKQAYIQNARELGRLDNEEVQNAILEFDRQIKAEQKSLADEALQQQKERSAEYVRVAESQLESERSAYQNYTHRIRELNADLNDGLILSEREKAAVLRNINEEYTQATVSEYNDLYGLLEDKVKGFTGLSSKEFGILEEVVQLTFGVNITDTIKGTFAQGISSILGFRNQGSKDLTGFAGQTPGIFGQVGGAIEGTFLQTGLSAIGSFVSNSLGSLGGLANGIFQLFGGVGDFLGSTFGGAFRSISGAIGSLFGSGGGGGGSGIGGLLSAAGTALFGPVGGFVGSLFGGLFDEGGYIKPGQFGIVGERGPELVSGPANVVGREDTADMLGGGRNVNVNFSINAVDAAGVDQILVERKDLITTIVRNAVQEQGGYL